MVAYSATTNQSTTELSAEVSEVSTPDVSASKKATTEVSASKMFYLWIVLMSVGF